MKVLIIKSRGNSIYHKKIAEQLRLFDAKTYISSWKWKSIVGKIKRYHLLSRNTVIHSRAGGYQVSRNLSCLEGLGYKVVPSSKSVFFTSNKYISQLIAYENRIPVAPTYLTHKNDIKRILRIQKKHKYLVVKPIFSPGQSRFCLVIRRSDGFESIQKKLNRIPGNFVLVQKYIEHEKLVRCVVLANKIVSKLTTYKKNINFQISQKMKKVYPYEPDRKLSDLAEKCSRVFDTDICYADFFVTKNCKYIFNEINLSSGFTEHDKMLSDVVGKHVADYLTSRKILKNSEGVGNKISTTDTSMYL